jgi:hypothetical protein
MPEKEADRLRRLAMEALQTAAEMTDDAPRRVMIEVAAAYARLADYVDEHKAAKPLLDEPD